MGTKGSPRTALIIRLVMSLVTLFFTWAGIRGGMRDLAHTATGPQAVQSLTQLGYGLSAMLCALVAWRPHRLSRVVHVLWYVTCALSAGLAPVVWGSQSPWIGLVSAAAALLLAWLILWPLRRWGVPPAV